MRTACAKARLDAFLVTRAVDVGYLCGFGGEDSFLVFSAGWAVLITDGRFAEQAVAECGDIEIHNRTGPIAAAVAQVLRGRSVRRLGVQAGHVTLSAREALTGALGKKELIPIPSATESSRIIKDAGEIRLISQAVRIAQRAFVELTSRGASRLIGRSERQVAAELEYLMRQGGADGAAFETIVAAGANSSRPHHRPGGRKIKPAEAVLIDWGAKTGGYCSDLTRVVFTGRIPPKLAGIYEVVRSAQAAALRAIRPGVACRSVDAAAREVIVRAGFGKEFVHSLGHGLGREVHEKPVLGKTDTGRLRAGMVVTVEPGVYLPGVGGVRIEDDVLVTSRGRRRLSSLGRSPDEMVLR